MTHATFERPAWEVADVIRQYGATFRAKYGAGLTRVQRQALRDLVRCRTAALGGHVEQCLDCGHQRPAYNSCRNRHCPKCQALTRAVWLERQAQQLLPVEYFHVVFTLPAEIATLAMANGAVLYDRLFVAAARSVHDVAANPKHLGAVVGTLLVLHTWGQNLCHHPHVHAVVTGGGLSCDATGTIEASPRWVACRPGFFLPVRVLSRLFRGKYLALLRQAFDEGQLLFRGRLALLQEATAFERWLTALYAKEWVVYAKRPWGGPEQVLKYLARYTHRVAISNARLLAVHDGQVTFRYKDYADEHKAKALTLTAEEFLRRFVQHVLPKGFVKMRHYGLLANRRREELLRRCRSLLLVAAVPASLGSLDTAVAVEPAREHVCPACGSRRLTVRELPREDGTAAAWCDTS
jgi:Putative transposase/Transposase zinc-binding domain